MNPSQGDTLDIKPVQPGPNQPTSQPASGSEAEAARARIAELSDPHAGTLEQGQAVSLRRPIAAGAGLPPVPAPASPAAEALKPKLPSLPQFNQAKIKRKIPSPVKPLLSALGAFVLLVMVFKAQIILSQLKYLTGKTQTVTSNIATPAASIPPDPTISIPKINVNAPVVYEPSIAEAAIQKALVGGVVHYGTSVTPGQPGNLVIVGHSSNDWWQPGNYKFVFVLLDKLAVGDQFSLNYQSHKYIYEVTLVKIVEPTDLSVLANTPSPTATLITCTPPGTSWRRLVVQANQISPEPTSQTPSTVDNSAGSSQALQLPSDSPSLGSQLSRAWHNLTTSISNLIHGKSSTTNQPTEQNSTQPSNSTLPSGL
ncbi:MAG TPA: sortase [Candidatus Saccharimonadales bacterium]|nr:sortase [Candidatus Saccharimonadales bacterium]